MAEQMMERVNAAIAAAMREKSGDVLAPLRLLKAALVNRRVERGADLTDEESLRVVASLIKQRREAIEQYREAGRGELADKEALEIEVLEPFLPPPVTAAEIEEAVDTAIRETGADSPRQIGAVMKHVMAGMAGRNVDGKAVNAAARRKLGA